MMDEAKRMARKKIHVKIKIIRPELCVLTASGQSPGYPYFFYCNFMATRVNY